MLKTGSQLSFKDVNQLNQITVLSHIMSLEGFQVSEPQSCISLRAFSASGENVS